MGYMMGNFEALVRNGIAVTTIHVNNRASLATGRGFGEKGMIHTLVT